MSIENKNLVLRALAGLIETRNADALAPFLHEDFLHRRPGAAPTTKSEWLASVRTALVQLAGMQVEILQILSDGDRVVLCSRRWLPGGPEIVVVDLWRFADGLFVEAYEVIEPVSRVDANLRWWEAV